jgi:hypothetical protein
MGKLAITSLSLWRALKAQSNPKAQNPENNFPSPIDSGTMLCYNASC